MAETVVLLHGFAGTRHGWAPVADRLARDYGFALRPNHFAVLGRCAACAATTPGT